MKIKQIVETFDPKIEARYGDIISQALKGDLSQWHTLDKDEKSVIIRKAGDPNYAHEVYIRNADPDKWFQRYISKLQGMAPELQINQNNQQYNVAAGQQDNEYELSLGSEKRKELKQKADELAEIKREKLRNERLEDEAIAYKRFKETAERKAAMAKIREKYAHELALINTEHRNNMESIRTNNAHEIHLMDKELEKVKTKNTKYHHHQHHHDVNVQQPAQGPSPSYDSNIIDITPKPSQIGHAPLSLNESMRRLINLTENNMKIKQITEGHWNKPPSGWGLSQADLDQAQSQKDLALPSNPHTKGTLEGEPLKAGDIIGIRPHMAKMMPAKVQVVNLIRDGHSITIKHLGQRRQHTTTVDTRKMDIQNPYREIHEKPISQMDEDGVTVATVSGDKAKLSTGQEIDAKSLTPDAQHPGQYTMPQMDPNAIKPGAVVNTDTSSTTSEDAGDTPYYTTMKNGQPVVKSGNGFTPIQASKLWTEITPEVEEKATSQGFRRIEISANGQTMHGLEGGGKVIVSPRDFQTISTTKESHHDTIHSGNHDIGGDATDNFIDQVRDKGYERAQRPMGESAELTAMLRIAGLR